MKSILYVGATLMIGASVYGFVDYKQTSQQKGFTEMYAEEKTVEEKVAQPAVVTLEEKKETPARKVVARKTAKPAAAKKAAIGKGESLPVIKPIADEEKMTSTGTKTIEKPSVTVMPAKDNNVAKKAKKRKVSTKLFSRGALDERYIEPTEKSKSKKD